MANNRSQTYQLEPLEGYETVAGDQTLRSQYSIVPENMRDEIENREVWNSIGDVGEGLWNIASGTAEGFGYDLEDPTSLAESLLMGMILPPTLKNVLKGAKKTKKGLNPYQKAELTSKAPSHPYRETLPSKYNPGINVHDPKAIRDFHRKNPYSRQVEIPMGERLKRKYGINTDNFPPKVPQMPMRPTPSPGTPYSGIPMQKIRTTKNPNNILRLLPLLLASGGKSTKGDSEENILDSLIMDMEPMDLRRPNFEEQILEMIKEDSSWRY